MWGLHTSVCTPPVAHACAHEAKYLFLLFFLFTHNIHITTPPHFGKFKG